RDARARARRGGPRRDPGRRLRGAGPALGLSGRSRVTPERSTPTCATSRSLSDDDVAHPSTASCSPSESAPGPEKQDCCCLRLGRRSRRRVVGGRRVVRVARRGGRRGGGGVLGRGRVGLGRLGGVRGGLRRIGGPVGGAAL